MAQRVRHWLALGAAVLGAGAGAGAAIGGVRLARAYERRGEELRRGFERLGGMLARTHDLEGLLQVALDGAVGGVNARGGLAMVVTASGDLALAAQVGLREQGVPVPQSLRRGEGILGRALTHPRVRRGAIGVTPGLEPAPAEPGEGQIMVAPLQREGAVVAVLAVLEPREGERFTASDERDLATFAAQAEIAVDNILLHREAQRLAITDPLTGVWNFRYLSMSLAREVERAARFDRPLAVLMLDLDRFKDVNDAHGHARGDAVLRELAHRLSLVVREVDVLARYGGEEFVLVLPETDVAGAARLAERVVDVVRRKPFVEAPTEPGAPAEPDASADPLHVTASVGAAVFPLHGDTAAALMHSADAALYAAKQTGRDTWLMATAPEAEDRHEDARQAPG